MGNRFIKLIRVTVVFCEIFEIEEYAFLVTLKIFVYASDVKIDYRIGDTSK